MTADLAIAATNSGLGTAPLNNATQALANRSTPLANGVVAKGGGEKAVEEFEAFFISQMLGYMFTGIETDPMFGGGQGETMFRSLMVDEYGKSLARSGGIGLSDGVMSEIIRMQEGQ